MTRCVAAGWCYLRLNAPSWGEESAHQGLWDVMGMSGVGFHRDVEQVPSGIARPRIVVVATVHWPVTTRLCLEMAESGIEVRALVPDDHALFKMCAVTVDRLGRTRHEALRTISRTVARHAPDLLIPADESAIDLLRALYSRAMRGRGMRPDRMAALIEASMGAPSSFVFGRDKSRFMTFAREEGIAVPRTEIVANLAQLRAKLATARFPLVIKRDGTSGGEGVRVVADAASAERAFLAFRSTGSRLYAVRQAVRKVDPGYLRQLLAHAPAITVQDHVAGRPANRAVVCHRGEVLAGLSVEVLQAKESTGPATVVRVIDQPEMAHAAQHIVRRLCLSGFVGFDFMLETTTGRPYLIEMNQRPTQICHLASNAASDMIGALTVWLPATDARRATPYLEQDTIALFPQESWRDPASAFLSSSSAYHDVPWQAPEFIDAYRAPVAPEPLTWVQVVRQFLRDPRRFFARRVEKAALSIGMAPAINPLSNSRDDSLSDSSRDPALDPSRAAAAPASPGHSESIGGKDILHV